MNDHTAHISYYEILEVEPAASFEEIEKSYQRISTYIEQDSLAIYSIIEDDEITQHKSQIDQAYYTLNDPNRRAAYDQILLGKEIHYPAVVIPKRNNDPSLSVGQVASKNQNMESLKPNSINPLIDSSSQQNRQESPPKHLGFFSSPEQETTCVTPSTAAKRSTSKPIRPKTPALRINPEIEVNADTEFSGALLQRLRESAGATLEDLSNITKINKRYLKAIENNDFDILPAGVYIRGFVSEYARALGISPHNVANSYIALVKRYKEEKD